MVKVNVDDELVNADWPKALQDQIEADKRLIGTKVKKTLGDDFRFRDLVQKAEPRRLEGFRFPELVQKRVRDGDGDGRVFDGTPRERPALPSEKKPEAKASEKKRTLRKPTERKFGVDPKRARPGHRPATQEDIDRIKGLTGKAVPPAWTDMQVPEDDDNDNYIIGFDAKNRPQRVQKPETIERNAAAKFERIRELSQHIPLLDKELEEQVELGPTYGALALIRYGGLRPGSNNDTGAEKQAYGATNMLVRHATVSEDGKSVHIKMTGKKGVALDLTIEHPLAVKAVQAHAKDKDPDEPLFGTTPAKTLKVLKGVVGDEFQVKDLRTYVATSLAYDLVRTQDPPTSAKDYATKRRAIGKQVSDVLGNTPTMALNSYISPLVFAQWTNAWETE